MNKDKLLEKADILVKRVDNYANSILDGTINACQKTKWACERYFKDKENENFIFDKTELLKIYVWASQFKHTKGSLAGKHIELTDFNLFELANIFCWKKKSNGLRRFRKVYIQLARKNMKTQLLAIISSYVAFTSTTEIQEIYLAGWDKEQSSKCYDEILNELEACPKFKGKFSKSYGKISVYKNKSKIIPLSREARKTGDGSNPSLGVCDEYHAHKTSEIYDVINSGMGARKEPLMVIITTPGFEKNCPCHQEYEYVSKILDPNQNVTNDSYFVLIYELESEEEVYDEKNWIKANPIICTYEEGIEGLREEVKVLKDNPSKKRDILTKRFGIWVDMKKEGYMNMSKWKEAEEIFTLDKFMNMDCVMGMDLSKSLDLTSIAFEFKIEDKYYIYQHSFIPDAQYQKRLKENKYDFFTWKDQGFLTVIPGETIDLNYVRDYMDYVEGFKINIKEICYDPAWATQFVVDLTNEGYTCVEVRQGALTLTDPTDNFRKRVYDGTMKHTNDGLFDWAMGNAVCAHANRKQEFLMLDKSQSYEKIDPCAASMNAHFRATKVLDGAKQDVFYVPRRRLAKA